jgi:hypothetical protein
MKQSRLMSLVEAAANVAVGYGVAVITQILIFPVFGLHTTLAQNLQMGAVFTVVSIARSFGLRRLFEAIRVRATKPPLRTSGGSVPVRLPYRRDFGAPGRDQASSR